MFSFKNKNISIIFFILLVLHIFLRFNNISTNQFTFDQVNNAWTSKNFIVDHKLPLLGVPVKGNSGFYLGPLYYYYVIPFYLLSNLDPIASALAGGVASIVTFITIYFVIRKMFDEQVALVMLFIHTVSFAVLSSDRVQWNVNFIEPLSLLIFYSLYKVLQGENRYLILFFIGLGLFFHIHFTAIFFPVIFIFCLPFMSFKRDFMKYLLIGIFISCLFLIPNILAEIQMKNTHTTNMIKYMNENFHGLHLRRVLQLTSDAFIEFDSILFFNYFKYIKYVLFFGFIFIFLYKNFTRKRFIITYLIFLWFIIPWIIFSLYKGEISDYYFYLNRPLVITMLAFMTLFLYMRKNIILKVAILLAWIYYSYHNLNAFFSRSNTNSIGEYKKKVLEKVKKGYQIPFSEGDPESYIYYFYEKNGVSKT